GFTCVGFVELGREALEVDRIRILGRIDDLSAVLARAAADEIVVAVRTRRDFLPVQALARIEQSGVRVVDYAAFYERETGRVDLEMVLPTWFPFAEGFPFGRMQDVLKRAFDIVVSMVLLVLTAPLMLATAIAIRVEGPGPVLLWQERVGMG